MALPMVHLIAAYEWASDKPHLSEDPNFYLGTLAPDAIHIRDGNDKSHKNEIHLFNWRSLNTDNVVAYWEKHRTPFDIGYGIHVLLDGQWTERFHARLTGMLLPNGKPDTTIYYNDTIINDFRLYRECPQTAFFFDMLMKSRAPEKHPLLTAYEIEEWKKATFTFYDRECPKNDPVRFVTREYVEEFLKDCKQVFDETYGRIKW